MGQITVERDVSGIAGLCVITPALHGDARGWFMETYSERDMAEAGLDIRFVQDNQSFSRKGVLRGMHFQRLHPQAKLVRVSRGAVCDAVIDIREGSPTFGKSFAILLSGENRKQLLVPRGMAHGYLVLSDEAEFCYKCDEFWHPEDEGGVAWNDPDAGIAWPGVTGTYPGSAGAAGYRMADGTPLSVNTRDQSWPRLRDAAPIRVPDA